MERKDYNFFPNKKWGKYKKWEDKAYVFFSKIEDDFRLLNMPSFHTFQNGRLEY